MADHLALSHHGDPFAQLLDLLEFVRHEYDAHALSGERVKRCEELDALRSGDPGRRLVEDQDAGSQPQEAGDL